MKRVIKFLIGMTLVLRVNKNHSHYIGHALKAPEDPQLQDFKIKNNPSSLYDYYNQSELAYSKNNHVTDVIHTPYDDLREPIYKVITRATKSVDVMILSDIEEPYLSTFIDCLEYLNNKAKKNGNTIIIRVMIALSPQNVPENLGGKVGWAVDKIPFEPVKMVAKHAYWSSNKLKYMEKNAMDFLSRIEESKYKNLNINIGVTQAYKRWSHNKIIVVDSATFMTGGANFYKGYDTTKLELFKEGNKKNDTIDDIMIIVEGEAAVDVQSYVNKYWDSVSNATAEVTTNGEYKIYKLQSSLNTVIASKKDPFFSLPQEYKNFIYKHNPQEMLHGGIAIGDEQGGPGLKAISSIISKAKKNIKISQQALFYPTDSTRMHEKTFIDALETAILNNVSIDIILSTYQENGRYGSAKGGGSKGYGSAKASDVKSSIMKLFDNEKFIKSSLLTIHNLNTPNHAKFVMVDDCILYVGSQNLYPTSYGYPIEATLHESGVIINMTDDPDTLDKFINIWKEQKNRAS